MYKIIPAATLIAILFLLWGLGITHVMAQDQLPSENNKQISTHPEENIKQKQRSNNTNSQSQKPIVWDKSYQEIEKELKKEQEQLKALAQ